MKYIRLPTFFLLLCFTLCSCGGSRYTGNYSPEELTHMLKSEIPLLSQYGTYSAEDVEFMLDTDAAQAFSVIYSRDGEDIGEVGIFKAYEGEDVEDMLEEVREYIESVRTSRLTFVKNYIPEEMPKLDGARAMSLGRYVCYCVLDSASAKQIFDKLTVILSE